MNSFYVRDDVNNQYVIKVHHSSVALNPYTNNNIEYGQNRCLRLRLLCGVCGTTCAGHILFAHSNQLS